MDTLANFFAQNIIGVYFFYGLSFFCMGLAIFLEMGHSSELEFSQALRPLAGFGLVHGSHEWFEMFLLIYPQMNQSAAMVWITPLRLLLLASSFLMLIAFGARLISGRSQTVFTSRVVLLIIAIWLVGLSWVINIQVSMTERIIAADVYTRYALAIPGAALAVWGLILQRQRFIDMGMPAFGRDVVIAAVAFSLYGGIGQLFAAPSRVFPSGVLNAEVFIHWFGFPVQVFRASMAAIAAVFIIRSLRAFEVETRRRIEALRDAQQAERRRLEALRAELLYRTVKAQESERQRIARELHDETGQRLTALGMGLRGLSETLRTDPQRAAQQAQRLESLAVKGLEDLQRLISGLHPPQLDDLGLLPALRWYANQVREHYGLPVIVSGSGDQSSLSPELRTVIFRIAQEAVTNCVRHANATQVSIDLNVSPASLRLHVQDNGAGFDVQETLSASASRPCWGLLGMIERAKLIGGECQITSQPGAGTRIEVVAPLEAETNV
ncbi:MAG: sensor histidine kinase [Anaerolineales bacterium]|nr:sensor histidine kinase [Anaerolineales bacterium]